MVTMPDALARFLGDEDGATLVEATITLSLLIFMLAAFVEFTSAVHQWNMAVKGVQIGARLASISDPVDSSLKDVTGLDGVEPGDPIATPWADRVCNSKTQTCTNGTWDAASTAAMNRIIFGSDSACGSVTPGDYSGICDAFPGAARGTVEVTYANGGLGYAGRPGGAVPVIQVKLKDLALELMILDAFIGRGSLTMPEFNATSVGEDLAQTYTN